MVIVAPRSAKLVEARGARFTLLIGYVFCLLGFLTMLLLWNEGIAYWKVGLGYALDRHRRRLRRHAGLALAHRLGARSAAPAWRRARPTSSATSAGRSCSRSSARCSPPGYAVGDRRGDRRRRRTATRSPTASRAELTKSFASAEPTSPQQYPQYADQIIAAAKSSFLDGDDWAYTAGIVAILLGAALVFFMFPQPRRRAARCSSSTRTRTQARRAERLSPCRSRPDSRLPPRPRPRYARRGPC